MRTMEEAEKLFNENITLAYYIAGKFSDRYQGCPDMDRDDAVQMCLLGLWTAACKYDAARRAKFGTFACTCMVRQLLSACRKSRRRNAMQALSIEAALNDQGEFSETVGEDCLAAPGDIENDVCDNIIQQDIILSLPPEMRPVVEACMGGMTRAEAERRFHVSKTFVSQAVNRAAMIYAAKYFK